MKCLSEIGGDTHGIDNEVREVTYAAIPGHRGDKRAIVNLNFPIAQIIMHVQ